MAEIKTNAMRMLDKAGVVYTLHTYPSDGGIDGLSIAAKMGQPVEMVYKTLVTKGKNTYFVFVIPVAQELDLKAAARTVGEKAVEMIAVKDINKVTGYIRGGCSPVGMKKQLKTVIDASAENLHTFYVSGGRIGLQMQLNPKDLCAFIGAQFAYITL